MKAKRTACAKLRGLENTGEWSVGNVCLSKSAAEAGKWVADGRDGGTEKLCPHSHLVLSLSRANVLMLTTFT